ncbi:DUF2029 domain-containing protein [Nocardioides sp. BGMRC 2183]|nr:DUF2029 domain-containing protein [Nocardioides sp. BGMRC 2183]
MVVIAPEAPRVADPARRRRHRWLLAGILLLSLSVRLVALRHGLPHAYNADEELHYVPQATRAADGDWYSGYFENPSGYTYLVALVYRGVFAGQDVSLLLVDDPAAVLLLARLVTAFLGTAAVAAVYLVGRRFAGTTVGLCAAAFLGLAYLPVFYSHQALNDVPALVPTALALLASLRYYDEGRRGDLLLAGAAVGVAAGIKYLAAPMALVVAAAALLRAVVHRSRTSTALAWLVASGAACIAALLLLNPFLVVEFGKFLDNMTGQSAQAATTKLGQSGTAWLGYPTSLAWGFGVIPTLLAGVGVVLAWRADRARATLLLLFPVALYLTMGVQERYFGRWMLPAYPALAVLAGYGAVRTATALGRVSQVGAVASGVSGRSGKAGTRRHAGSHVERPQRSQIESETPRSRRGLGRHALRVSMPTRPVGLGAAPAMVVVLALALAQPVIDVVRSDLVLTRTDTRTTALAWMSRTFPDGARVVLEPAFPGSYRRELRSSGVELASVSRPFQEYELRLEPDLLDAYRVDGYCWVVVSGHQHDRGLAAGLIDAAAYYERLARESDLVYRTTPFAAGGAGDFSYDFSFNYYPPAYRRPGPVVEIYRLHDCAGA